MLLTTCARVSAVRRDPIEARHAPGRLRTCHLSNSGAMLGSRVQVDVVGADARRQDELQLGRLLEQLLYMVAVSITWCA